MKKIIKKLLKWTGITLLLLIIALILIPIFFKDELKQLVIDEVNKSLTAELSLDDFDLTFFSTFPNMTIALHDAKLTGLNEFKGVKLADIKKIEAHIGFWSVVAGDQIEIDEIHIIDPTFDVRVLESGLANFDIVKPDSVKTVEEIEEPSSFKLTLNEYSITNAKIIYDDKASNMYLEIDSLTHTGTGDLTADVIDFETTTTMNKLTYQMDGVSYLTEVKTEAVINLLMEFTDKSSKFTLKENEIKLNALTFSMDGFYEMLEDHDNLDFKLNASKATFKEFLSLIPTFYQSGYEGMLTSGTLGIKGFVKGELDETNLPGWDINMKVNNAAIKYPGLPGKITNIQIDGGSKFKGGDDLDLMTIEMPRFHANFSKNSIDVSLFLNRLISDPYIKSGIKANMDLSTLKDFVPTEEGESYSGILDADVNIEGKMSDLENENFEAFTAEGELMLSKMLYQTASLPNDVDIQNMKFTFSPQNLTLNELDAKMGKSDFSMDGKIDNYLGYMLRDEVLKGDFNFNSNYLDLDELMGTSSTTTEAATVETTEATTGEPRTASAEEEPTLVPGNIDFLLASSIQKIRYNGIDVKNIKGNVRLKDEVASIENLTMDAMGGEIGLNGSYNTQDHSTPKMDFSYTLKEIDINQLATNFLTVGKLAPIAKYAKGKISSNFDMQTDLTSGFEPILSSLTSIGDLSSNTLSISGFKLLEKIENKTKLKDISTQTINNFKTKFTVKDGKVTVTPFDVKLGGIATKVSGYTTLDQQMNYDFNMNVPKDKIPASMIKEVEKAMGKLNALVPKLDIGKLPDFIPVKVNASGDPKDPKITTDFKEAILKATGDFKDNIIESVKETVKDTIQSIVTDQVDNIKEELEAQKKNILDNAQKQADKVKNEAKKAADVVRAEADKQGKQLIKEAGGNPIKKKLAEAAAKKGNEAAEKKAKKIEDEGNKKADDIMNKAREKADKLG